MASPSVTPKPPSGAKQAAAREPGFAEGLLILATCGTLALPVVLPYARAIADALLSLIAVVFLVSRYGESDWDWLRAPQTRLMLVLWAWMLLCTLLAAQRADD